MNEFLDEKKLEFRLEQAEEQLAEADRELAETKAKLEAAEKAKTKLENVLAWIRRRVDPTAVHDTHTTLSMLLRKLDENGIKEDQSEAKLAKAVAALERLVKAEEDARDVFGAKQIEAIESALDQAATALREVRGGKDV